MSLIPPAASRRFADLFDGKSQLIVYHFMFGPDGRPVARAVRTSRTTSRHPGSPCASGRHLGRSFARAPGADRSLQEAYGLALPMGLVFRERFQPRLRVSFTKEETTRGKVPYNYDMVDFPSEEGSRAQALSTRMPKARSSTPIPHTLAASTSWSAPTTFSIWRRRAVTRMA